MDRMNECYSFCLIDGKGTFNVAGIKTFEKEVKLDKSGLSYATLSIMGPQSSGKSTLLNHLFGTNFREMDAFKERGQTTQGIWLAKCPGIEPCTLVMDLEGSDGRERGEDDTAFEKQAALFAFSVSDIVLINMWCHDVGRVQAANQPLLRTVFEAMGKLFSYRKTTLWIVLRDKTRTPKQKLEELLWQDLQQIWNSLANPHADKGTPLSEIFNVKITALTSYEDMEDQFKEEVVELRQQLFSHVAHGRFVGDGRDIVPDSGFSFTVQGIWETIKESKDLYIPAQRIMVATVRCEEIANKMHDSFITNEYWCQLEKDVQSHPVPDFGKKVNRILDSCLSEYDAEAKYFDEGVRIEKRKQLQDQLLQIVELAWKSMLEHVHSDILDKFKEAFHKKLNEGGEFSADASDCANSFMTQFDKECLVATVKQASWDSSKLRDKLQNDIDAHVAAVRLSTLSELFTQHKANLKAALSGPVETLLVRAGDDTWQEIRKLYGQEIQSCFNKLYIALSGFKEDEQTKKKRHKELTDYARGIIQAKARQEARRVLTCMKERFGRFFSHDSDSNLRVWNGEEDIPAIRLAARSASLKLLSIMAVIRLDDDADHIEKTLFSALLDNYGSTKLADLLGPDTWEKVSPSDTLITPVESKDFWRQFNEFSEPIVTNAQVIVATIRCAAIASKKHASFVKNQDWCRLEKDVKSHPVPNLWKKLNLIIETCLSAYDAETRDFDEGVRTEKRRQLKYKLLQAWQSMFEHIRSRTLNKFKEAFSEKLKKGEEFYVAARDSKESSIAQFDEECTVDVAVTENWDSSQVRDKLQHDIAAHVAAVCSSRYEAKLEAILSGPVKTLLVRAGDDTWKEIRKLFSRETQSCFSELSSALRSFDVDEENKHKMIENLEDYARRFIERKAREEAGRVLIHMKDRFERYFSCDSNSKLQVWSGKEDALAIREAAYSESLKLLSIMAATRLEEDADDIEKTLFCSLMANNVSSTKLSDPLVSDTWEKVPLTSTLIKPFECKEYWRQFIEYSEPIVIQAQVTNEYDPELVPEHVPDPHHQNDTRPLAFPAESLNEEPEPEPEPDTHCCNASFRISAALSIAEPVMRQGVNRAQDDPLYNCILQMTQALGVASWDNAETS